MERRLYDEKSRENGRSYLEIDALRLVVTSLWLAGGDGKEHKRKDVD